jgi:putative peptidoglycan lipid II flippase
MSGLVKSTIIITILNGLGLCLGFVSNLLIAAKFGAGSDMDIYLAATTLPLFVTTIVSGSLAITFIPVFAEYRQNRTEVWNIVSTFINLTVVVTVFFSFIGILYSDTLTKLLTPGFPEAKVHASAELLSWLMPTITLTVVNELLSSIYYSNNKFVVPLINKIVNPIVTVIYVLIFSSSLSTKSLVFASLTAMILQTLLLIAGFLRNKEFSYSFLWAYDHPAVKKIFKLMIPLIGGMMVYRAIPLFDRFVASGLPDGSISYLGYSSRIHLLISSIITSGISLSLFPFMSRLMAENNLESLKKNISKSIRFLFFLSIPVTCILGFYGSSVVQLLFERGSFHSQDTHASSLALSIYLLALPAVTVGTIIGQVYYVLQDTRTPAIIGVLEVFIYLGLAFLLLPSLGFLAIPVTYVVYFYVSMINAVIVRNKLGGTGGGKIVKSFVRHTLIAIVAAGIIFFPIQFTSILILKNILIAGGFVLYFALSKAMLKTEESELLWERIFVTGLKRIFFLKNQSQ